jgi:hypothetical protein
MKGYLQFRKSEEAKLSLRMSAQDNRSNEQLNGMRVNRGVEVKHQRRLAYSTAGRAVLTGVTGIVIWALLFGSYDPLINTAKIPAVATYVPYFEYGGLIILIGIFFTIGRRAFDKTEGFLTSAAGIDQKYLEKEEVIKQDNYDKKDQMQKEFDSEMLVTYDKYATIGRDSVLAMEPVIATLADAYSKQQFNLSQQMFLDRLRQFDPRSAMNEVAKSREDFFKGTPPR